jgi:hypothetical protein
MVSPVTDRDNQHNGRVHGETPARRPGTTATPRGAMDLKIATVITAIGLGVSGGLAVAGVGAAAAPVGLG